MLAHTGCRAVVVAEKYASEIEAVRDELPDLAHVLVRDQGYEAWLARQSIPIRRSIRRTTSSSVTPAAPRARRRVSPIRISPGSPPAATGSTSIRRSSRAIRASISRRSVTARVISSRRSGSTAAAMSCPRSSIRRPCPISNACWWRPRRSPTIRPSRPARSSETPCIRAMARPRYYLLR